MHYSFFVIYIQKLFRYNYNLNLEGGSYRNMQKIEKRTIIFTLNYVKLFKERKYRNE